MLVWAWVAIGTAAHVGHPFPGIRVTSCLRVADGPNLAHWTAVAAGLQSNDVIVAANHHVLTSGADLARLVEGLPVGTPVHYALLRHGQPLALDAPTQRLGWLDYLVSFGIFFLVALAMLAIGAAAMLLRSDNRAARGNFWLSTAMGLSFVLLNDEDLTHYFHPACYASFCLLYASGALSMALNFPATPAWLERRPRWQWLPYAVGFGLMAVVGAIFWHDGATAGAEADANAIFALWPMLVLALSLGLFCVRLWRAPSPLQQSQLKVLLLGMLVAYAPMFLVELVPGLTGWTISPVLSDLSISFWLIFPLTIVYAIVKHHLFDIDIIIKRTTTYAALTAFLVGGYFGMAASLKALFSLILGAGHGGDGANVLATAVIAVLFVPVRQAITSRIDRLFSRTKYNFREVVAKVTTTAQTTLDINEMKRQFMAAIDEALHPTYIYILTMVPQGDMLVTMGLEATWGDTPVADLKVLADDPLFGRDDADAASEVHYAPVTGLTGMLSPLAALGPHYRLPLKVGEEVVGLIVLGPKRSDEAYVAEDRELLAATRLPLAAAIKTAAMVDDKLFKDRVEQELKRAREVQEAMLPREVPLVAGFEFAASSEACYEASGDYYDFVELPDGRWGIAVADVAGKGIAAALATAMAKSGLYNQVQTDPEVIPVMSALNRLLHAVSKNATAKSFTTCLYGLLDPAGRHLTFSCAGHFPPLHYDARAKALTPFPLKGGFPLGVRANSKYVASQIALSPGDVLVFYTDGVTEAQAPDDLAPDGPIEPGEMFESDRLGAVLLEHVEAPAGAIHDAIKAAVDAFVAGGPQTDDITLVVIKVLALNEPLENRRAGATGNLAKPGLLARLDRAATARLAPPAGEI